MKIAICPQHSYASRFVSRCRDNRIAGHSFESDEIKTFGDDRTRAIQEY